MRITLISSLGILYRNWPRDGGGTTALVSKRFKLPSPFLIRDSNIGGILPGIRAILSCVLMNFDIL